MGAIVICLGYGMDGAQVVLIKTLFGGYNHCVQTTTQRLPRNAILFILLIVLVAVSSSLLPSGVLPWLWDRLNVFATVFLGIFVEAVPYLLLGTFASGRSRLTEDNGAVGDVLHAVCLRH